MNRIEKVKQHVKRNRVFYIGVGVGVVVGIVITRRSYGKKAAETLKYLTDNVEHVYNLGGTRTPLTYKLTGTEAAAYNRIADLIQHTPFVSGKAPVISANPDDMAIYNKVAHMTNDWIKKNGAVDAALFDTPYLVRMA
jgi:hypothetical protein